MPRELVLAETLVELADSLVDDFDVVELLTLLVEKCVEVLEVGAAGLMLVDSNGDLALIASSSQAMRTLELFELQAHEGPCIDCYRTGEPVMTGDLAEVRRRWPLLATQALSAGFQSMHALPMRLRGSVIGALNVFDFEAGEMRPDDVGAAKALANAGTIGILAHRAATEARAVNDELEHALRSRIVIEQAKGMVAEGAGLDMTQAFATLRGHARNNNLLLADVAHDVVVGVLATSALDPLPARPSSPT